MAPARIAIVDDDPQFAEYLSIFLHSRGYDTVIYPNGSTLLHAPPAEPLPDVVLLDVLMPSPDGLDTLRALRSLHADLPVIMVSGLQVPATIVDAVRLGAVDYVIKPGDSAGVEEAALEAAINRAIERVNLRNEVARLSAQMPDEPDGSQPWWSSGPAMRQAMTMVDWVADSDVTVLLSGESGVGKGVIAREIHRRSPRRLKPFVTVDCASLPAELLESELFGHERGAFTGAQAARVGKFAFASEGTILLDEIGELPMALQSKLLHVLQDRSFTRLGSNQTISVDVRVIAATNRDLGAMRQARLFRDDLYYRLQVIEIVVPPLRKRREEIPALTEFFLRRYGERYRRQVSPPSPALRRALLEYPWPGNVRELENMIKRFVVLQDESLLLAELQRGDSLPPPSAPPVPEPVPTGTSAAGPAAARPTHPPAPEAPATTAHLPDLARNAALAAERDAIQQALDRFRWNRRKAARQLGVSYKTLLSKIKQCGIAAPDADPEEQSVER